MSTSGWIGVDLDGTLAHYTGWKGPEDIGEPIPAMLVRVRHWIAEGVTVKIFTARACIPEQIPAIKAWLARHGLADLEVTNIKDFSMYELWDDRAVGVIPNTGYAVSQPAINALLAARKRLKRVIELAEESEAPEKPTGAEYKADHMALVAVNAALEGMGVKL